MQHLVIQIRQGDAITVTHTRRLSPHCHLLGISTKLNLIIQMLVKTRNEGIARHLRDAVSHQRRIARRPCLSSIANSAYFKFYSQSLAFNVPLSWTLVMLQFSFSPFLFSSSSMRRRSCASRARCSSTARRFASSSWHLCASSPLAALVFRLVFGLHFSAFLRDLSVFFLLPFPYFISQTKKHVGG